MKKGILIALLIVIFATASAKAFFVEDLEAKTETKGVDLGGRGVPKKHKKHAEGGTKCIPWVSCD